MFVPVPPNSDETPANPAEQAEPELEPVVATPRWRGRGRWPALLRFSRLLRLIAMVNLTLAAVWGLVSLFLTLVVPEPSRFLMLLSALGAFVSAVVGYIVWTGLAEGILLLIAMERTLRQTRDRLPDPRSEEESLAFEDLEI